MADKTTIETLKAGLRKTAEDYNDSVSKTESESTQTKLYALFSDMQTSMKSITSDYASIISEKRKIAEAYVVAAIYQLYGTLFRSKLEAFSQIAALAGALRDSSSSLNDLLSLIEKALAVYYSDSTQEEKAAAKTAIAILLAKLRKYLGELMGKLSFIPSDATIDSSTKNSDGTYALRSESNLSFTPTPDASAYSVFSASLDNSGLIGQQMSAYIRIKASDNVSSSPRDETVKAYVTIPLSKMLNSEFLLSEYRFLIFWQMPCYLRSYQEDNDGSDSKVTTAQVTKQSVIRLGGVFSQTNVFGDGTVIKYKHDSSQSSWSNGRVSSVGSFIDKGMTIVCGKTGANRSYDDYYHVADSAKVSASATISTASSTLEYSVSGTLDYDKDLSEETKSATVFSGSLTVKCGDESTSRPVLLTLRKNGYDYDIELSLDPSSTTNASANISDNALDASNIAPIVISRTYKGVSKDTLVPTDGDAKMKAVQAMETISSLNPTDIGSFSAQYSAMKALLNECSKEMDSVVASALAEVSSAGTSATEAMAVVQSNDKSYSSDGYASDVEEKFSEMAAQVTTYSESTSSSDDLYDGAAYGKLAGLHDSFGESMSSLIDDLIEADDILDGLEGRLLLIADSESKDIDFSSSLTLMSNIMNGESETIEAYRTAGTEFTAIPIDRYPKWAAAYSEKVATASEAKASYMEYAYLLSVVKRNDSANSAYCESTSGAWLKAHNRLVMLLIDTYGRKIGNPFCFREDVADRIAGSMIDIGARTGIKYSSTPNSFYLRPMITSEFQALSSFDGADIEEMLYKANGNLDSSSKILNSWEQAVYAAALRYGDTSEAIGKMASMLSGKALNIREACLAYVLSKAIKRIHDDPDIGGIISPSAYDLVSSLESYSTLIKEYSYIYRQFSDSESDIALSFMTNGSALLDLLENGLGE